MSDLLEFFAVIKGRNAKTGRLIALASTGTVDRHREVILPTAYKKTLPGFKKNPVLLPAHTHRLDNGQPAIVGTCEECQVTEEGLQFEPDFCPAALYAPGTVQLGPTYAAHYESEPPRMRAFSVGFLPEAWEHPKDEDEARAICEREGVAPSVTKAICAAFASDRDARAAALKAEADGKGTTGSKVPERPFRIFTRVDLLEISCVPVPSNRESLIQMAARASGAEATIARDLVAAVADGTEDPTVRHRDVVERAETLEKLVAGLPKAFAEWVARPRSVPIVLADGALVVPAPQEAACRAFLASPRAHAALLDAFAAERAAAEGPCAGCGHAVGLHLAAACGIDGCACAAPTARAKAGDLPPLETRKWEESETEVLHRVREPGAFQPDSFRRVTIKKDKPRVAAIVGRLKGEETTTVQALRFPKADGWTIEKAKSWVADHFERGLAAGAVVVARARAGRVVRVGVVLDAGASLGPVAERLDAAAKGIEDVVRRLGAAAAASAGQPADAKGAGGGAAPPGKAERRGAVADEDTQDHEDPVLVAALEEIRGARTAVQAAKPGTRSHA